MKFLYAAVLVALVASSGTATACGVTMPADQILIPSVDYGGLNTHLSVSSRFAEGWEIDWFGASDANNVAFRARIVDVSGGALTALPGSWTQVAQPSARELVVTGLFYYNEAPIGGAFRFQSTGNTVAFHIEPITPYLTGYVSAVGQYVVVAGEDFLLSTVPVTSPVSDVFEEVFCAGFEVS